MERIQIMKQRQLQHLEQTKNNRSANQRDKLAKKNDQGQMSQKKLANLIVMLCPLITCSVFLAQ